MRHLSGTRIFYEFQKISKYLERRKLRKKEIESEHDCGEAIAISQVLH